MSGLSLGHYFGLKLTNGDLAQLDHSYTRPFQSLIHHAKTKTPARVLLHESEGEESEGELDVCEGVEIVKPPFDHSRNSHLLNETERFLLAHCSSKLSDEQEEWMSRNTWTPEQSALFARVMKVMDTARMARLSAQGHHNEPVLRSIYTTHAARQLRKIFAMIKWEKELTVWLHNTFFDGLSLRHLAIYIDMLQSLQGSIPNLVNQLMDGHKVSNPSRPALTSPDTILAFLRRSTDPNCHLTTVKPNRVAGSPLIMVVPHYLSTDVTDSAIFTRLGSLCNMGKLLPVSVSNTEKVKTLSQYTQQLVTGVRAQIGVERSKHVTQNVFCVGWGMAALTALHVSSVEPLSGTICLGLPLTKRSKQLKHVMSDIKCPVLLIVGTASKTSNVKEVEHMVANIAGDKRLVLIEDADENLCIPMSKQVQCGLTQTMLDQIIQDEIGDFMISIAGYQPPTKEELQEYEDQEIARNRKRKIEATVRKVVNDDHAMKRKNTKRTSLEKNKAEPIKKEKKKRKIKVRKSDSPFDYSVSDSERNDIDTLTLGNTLLAEASLKKFNDSHVEERYKTPEHSPSHSSPPGYDNKTYSSYTKFKSSSTAESYMKTYHLSKLGSTAQGGYMVYPGSRGSSPTYHPAHTSNLAKGTPSIYQSSVGFQRWN